MFVVLHAKRHCENIFASQAFFDLFLAFLRKWGALLSVAT